MIRLNDLHIKNYRGIKDLQINDFKRINLFVGDNGVGKTRVLKFIHNFNKNSYFYSLPKTISDIDKHFKSFCDNKDGMVLYDEICNGLYYKTLPLMWKSLIKIIKKINIQIFATTQSYETIVSLNRAYQEIGKDLIGDDEIRLFRLEKENDEINSILFDVDELNYAIKRGGEVR